MFHFLFTFLFIQLTTRHLLHTTNNIPYLLFRLFIFCLLLSLLLVVYNIDVALLNTYKEKNNEKKWIVVFSSFPFFFFSFRFVSFLPTNRYWRRRRRDVLWLEMLLYCIWCVCVCEGVLERSLELTASNRYNVDIRELILRLSSSSSCSSLRIARRSHLFLFSSFWNWFWLSIFLLLYAVVDVVVVLAGVAGVAL